MKLVWVNQYMSHLLVRIEFSNALPLVGKLASYGTGLLHTCYVFHVCISKSSTHAYITSCTLYLSFCLFAFFKTNISEKEGTPLRPSPVLKLIRQI